jgi:hypothetical protein
VYACSYVQETESGQREMCQNKYQGKK